MKMWRRLLCRLLKHDTEKFTSLTRDEHGDWEWTAIRCKRCGEGWPQCAWCGRRPATMSVMGGEEVCRQCVGFD